jgi:hypothetical protein
MLQIHSLPPGTSKVSIYHGVIGLSYDVLLGRYFDTFDKAGFKFRPIGVTVGHWDFAYNLRIYPDRFTPADFGFANPQAQSTDAETVHGFSVTWRW